MPVYDYECERCSQVFEKFHSFKAHPHYKCECGGPMRRLITVRAKPVVYEYYSENLDARVTGPRQRAKLAESLGLVEK